MVGFVLLPYVACKIMPELADFYIGGVRATSTSVISVPADFQAGCCLCPFVYNVVPERGDFFESGIAAARTGVVSIPTAFKARRRFCLVLN